MSEVINNALNGVNIIQTILLGLALVYWMSVIIGIIDLDMFDFDFDLDICENFEGFEAVLAFLNLKDLPIMFVFSIIILNFWIISMLMLLLPIKQGGLLNVILLIPALILSFIITKIVTNPLKGLFKKANEEEKSQKELVVGQIITLLCDVKNGRLGQGKIKRDGASILVNVKSEDEKQEFQKNEEAFVVKKDDKSDIYYIIKF